MNKYTIKNNEFYRIVDVIATPEEIQAFMSATKEEKVSLANTIESRFPDILVEGDELSMIETIYNMFKPELKENDVYELISFNVSVRDGVEGFMRGAYNYKLNNSVHNVIIN